MQRSLFELKPGLERRLFMAFVHLVAVVAGSAFVGGFFAHCVKKQQRFDCKTSKTRRNPTNTRKCTLHWLCLANIVAFNCVLLVVSWWEPGMNGIKWACPRSFKALKTSGVAVASCAAQAFARRLYCASRLKEVTVNYARIRVARVRRTVVRFCLPNYYVV